MLPSQGRDASSNLVGDTTVWVVQIVVKHEGSSILSIFSNLEAAEKYANNYNDSYAGRLGWPVWETLHGNRKWGFKEGQYLVLLGRYGISITEMELKFNV